MIGVRRVVFFLFVSSVIGCGNTVDPAKPTVVDEEKPVQVKENAFAFAGAEGFGRNATGG